MACVAVVVGDVVTMAQTMTTTAYVDVDVIANVVAKKNCCSESRHHPRYHHYHSHYRACPVADTTVVANKQACAALAQSFDCSCSNKAS